MNLKSLAKWTLVPIAIGTITTTIWLTNAHKPLVKLDEILIEDRPHVLEQEIQPEVKKEPQEPIAKSEEAPLPQESPEEQTPEQEGGNPEGVDKPASTTQQTEGIEDTLNSLANSIDIGQSTKLEVFLSAIRTILRIHPKGIHSRVGDMYSLVRGVAKASLALESLEKERSNKQVDN